MVWLGSLLAVMSAITFALNGAAVRRGVLTGTVAQAMAITVPMGVPIFLAAALATGAFATLAGFSLETVALLAAAGVLHFVWGRYCNYRATKAIGGNAATPLQQLDFPLKIALAIVFLGEVLTPLKILGIALIFLGGAVGIKRRGRRGAAPAKTKPALEPAPTEPAPRSVGAAAAPKGAETPAFVPRYAEGYTFALLSITGYGVSPLFIRMALEDMDVSAGIAGGLVSYIAATVVIALLFLKPGHVGHVLAIHRQSVRWFLLSSVFVGLSQMFRYMALAVAPITVVAPIQRSASLFRVMFNWLINRQHEVFEARLLLGILISVAGGVLLSLSTDFVAGLLPLPESVIEMIHWNWP